jgi:hypothetical protein
MSLNKKRKIEEENTGFKSQLILLHLSKTSWDNRNASFFTKKRKKVIQKIILNIVVM